MRGDDMTWEWCFDCKRMSPMEYNVNESFVLVGMGCAVCGYSYTGGDLRWRAERIDAGLTVSWVDSGRRGADRLGV